MSTKQVPQNQPLSWYRDCLDWNCRGSRGEGADYQEEDVRSMYFQKLNMEEERKYKQLMKDMEEMYIDRE